MIIFKFKKVLMKKHYVKKCLVAENYMQITGKFRDIFQ